MTREDSQRWRGRPFLSACLRLAVLLTPIIASVSTAWAVSHVLPRPHSLGPWLGRSAATLAVSTLVLVVTDRAARRLLPLAVLLRLGMAFPQEAPSRLAVARAAGGTRALEERVKRAREQGVDDEPSRAATEILALVAAVESHDRATRGHSERVRIYTDLLAEQLGLSQHATDRLRWAALLHDVGKLTVPADVLNKPAKLSAGEWAIVQRHPLEGARFTAPLRAWLGEWALAIDEHHERFDGRGYPHGRQGYGISLAGRIVSVADCYETMTASRAYHRPKNAHAAREELVRCSGTQFDPAMVRAFLAISVRRLSWASGPLSWVAQSPVLWGIETASHAGRVASSAVAGGALAMTVAQSGGAGLIPRLPASQAAAASGGATDARPVAAVRTLVPGASETEAPDPTASPAPSSSPSKGESPAPAPNPEPAPEPSDSGAAPAPSPSPTTSGKPGPVESGPPNTTIGPSGSPGPSESPTDRPPSASPPAVIATPPNPPPSPSTSPVPRPKQSGPTIPTSRPAPTPVE